MKKHTRFRKTIIIQDGPIARNGLRDNLDTTPRRDDVFHIVRQFDRIDLLALRYYGSVDLWWVIADYNNLWFPLELETGITLRLPSLHHLTYNLLGG